MTKIYTLGLLLVSLLHVNVYASSNMLPTIAVEEYAAKLTKWLNPSASNSDLNTIFSNLSSFSETDLDFMT